MSWYKVTNPGVSAVPIPDLGISVGASTTIVLSDYFSVNDLYLSADLEALIIATTLTVKIDFGTGYTSVAAADYTNRDTLGSWLNIYEITNENNNEDLVDGSDVNASGPSGAALHIHDARYYTETEIGGTGGAALVGVLNTGWSNVTGSTVQAALDSIDGLIAANCTLDIAYDSDADGILDVDGTSKPLIFRSNNSNDVVINRKSGSDTQDILRADVSADTLYLGALVSGALAKFDVHVLSNLTVDGDISFTGTITDTTVNNMNVTNQMITLRDGAATGSDAWIEVERGSSGADGSLMWDDSATRWKAGLYSSEETIALLEHFEVVTGVWEFQGSATTDPNFYMTKKAAAPTTNLGTGNQVAMAMIGGILCDYDPTRSKWLSVSRQYMYLWGRDNANNTNEYARAGLHTSNQGGFRLLRDSTLIGISIQTNGAETWTARVRKNGSATNLASLASGGAAGAQSTTIDVDFLAGDDIEVYIDGTQIDRPTITLEFACKF